MQGIISILPMILIVGGMFWFMSRGQKKQAAEAQKRQNMLDNISVGDIVVTIGGLHGVVSEVDSERKTVTLDCEGIFLEFDRAAMKTITPGFETENDDTVTEVELSETEDDNEE